MAQLPRCSRRTVSKLGWAGAGERITDRNGNYISSSTNGAETDWTDSAGRLALKVITGTSSIQYEFLDPTGAYQTTTLNLETINVKTAFGCSGVVEFTGPATVPASIVLPNNQQYQFTYEPSPGNSGYYTARLQRVTLPTLAAIMSTTTWERMMASTARTERR